MQKKIKTVSLLLLFFGLAFLLLEVPVLLFWQKLRTLAVEPQLIGFFLFQLSCAVLMFCLVYIFTRRVGREKLSDVGIHFNRSSIKIFLVGAILTLFVALGAWACYSFFNHPNYQILITNPYKITVILSSLFVIGILQASVEELMFRSWALVKIAELVGENWAIFLTGIFFGAIHLLNPSYNLFSALGTVFSGMLLATAFFRVRSIWFPIGLHFGWNYFLGAVCYNSFIFRITDASGNVVNLFSGGEKTVAGMILTIAAFVFVYCLKIKKISPQV